jgi:hypothetical protein
MGGCTERIYRSIRSTNKKNSNNEDGKIDALIMTEAKAKGQVPHFDQKAPVNVD